MPTREDTKALLPIIEAYAEGKTIQVRTEENKNWQDIASFCSFGSKPEDYRIKPEANVVYAIWIDNGSKPNRRMFCYFKTLEEAREWRAHYYTNKRNPSKIIKVVEDISPGECRIETGKECGCGLGQCNRGLIY
jgi:hypothetical protein